MGIKTAIDLGLTVPIVAGGISSPATLTYCGRRHRICLILLGMFDVPHFQVGSAVAKSNSMPGPLVVEWNLHGSKAHHQ